MQTAMLRWIAIGLLALAAVVLLWWWQQGTAPEGPAVSGVSAVAQRTAQAPPTPVPTVPPFRLAGVAVGGESSYAVIDDPHGVSALYRIGETVTGLGRVAGIAPQEVLIDTERGPLVLRLQPAPTKTPAPTATRTTAGATKVSPRPSLTPLPTAGSGRELPP